VAVIDRDGLAGLTMRAVAQELSMSTMSLYRYVAGREELEVLVAEAVLATVDDRPPPDGDWRTRVAALAGRVREATACHPATVPLTVAHRQRTPSGLRWSEAVLAILAEAGIDGERRVVAFRAIVAYLIGAIQLEHFGALDGPGTAALAALPPADFPHLAGTAASARGIAPDAEFDGGLRILLAGMAAGLERSRA